MILRYSDVLRLPTATASVDFATDHKIQTTIQEEFNNSTLLTIAHRLRTIIQYDRVLVLGKSSFSYHNSIVTSYLWLTLPCNRSRSSAGIRHSL